MDTGEGITMNKKVLIVDDSTFMRMVLRDIVSNNFAVEVIEADGEENALIALRAESPDLVLLDIVMNSSESEGIKILENIKLNYPKVVVIMITSIGHAAIKEQCAALGAKGYIQKPFDLDEIKTEINKYI